MEKKCYKKQCTTENGVKTCCRIPTCIEVTGYKGKIKIKKTGRKSQDQKRIFKWKRRHDLYRFEPASSHKRAYIL